MGSDAYGVSGGSSDIDIYGFTIPSKHMLFPHLAGEISGFGEQIKRFEVWQEHHVKTDNKEYDFCVYSIVKFFQLLMQNNPNMIDSLFVPRRCIIHTTALGEHVRDHRKIFLHKGAWHKFKGYAYAQMNKIEHKVNASNEKRAESIKEFGYDTKFSYHVVRLLNEIEQILVEGDLDLERNREQLKSIRRGEWTLEQLKTYFHDKEKSLEETYANSALPHGPNEEAIKQLLIDVLEMHYGNLSDAIAKNPSMDKLLEDLRNIVDRYATNIPVDTSENP
jgi:predicted nucleotidyltransferase